MRPVLALHCSLAHGGAFNALAQNLPGFALRAPDLIGHGKAPDWDGICDYHAAVTAQALAEIGDQPVDLIGHSFGGTVALRLAVEHPRRVRSLTLIEPVFFAAAKQAADPAWDSFLADHHAFAALVASGEKTAAAWHFHAVWGGDAGFDSLPARMQTYMADRIHLITAPWNVLLEDSANLQAKGRISALNMPVLLIHGDQSPPIINAIIHALAAQIPQATSAQIAGAGHMLPISHAAKVAHLVQGHLALT
jgi:lipase